MIYPSPGCREVFLEFDPSAVSRMNEKKIVAPGSPASSLLSELRLRGIVENAGQMCKVDISVPLYSNLVLLQCVLVQSRTCLLLCHLSFQMKNLLLK